MNAAPYRRFVTTSLGMLAAFWFLVEGIDVIGRVYYNSLPEPVLRFFILAIAAIAYGGFRLGLFHPLVGDHYGKWLRGTPWRPNRPLPFGPVMPTPLDLVPLLMIAGMTWRFYPEGNLWMIIQLALLLGFLGYGVGGMATMRKTGQVGLVYLWIALLMFTIQRVLVTILHLDEHDSLVLQSVAEGAAALVLQFILSVYGVRRSFNTYPWEKVYETKEKEQRQPIGPATNLTELFNRSLGKGDMRFLGNEMQVGLPVARMGPQLVTIGDRMSRRSRVMFSALVGWGVYLFVAMIVSDGAMLQNALESDPMVRARAVAFFSKFFVSTTGFFALIRLIFYVSGFSWPLGFWGRVFNFKWIIPGYDKILITPAIIAATGYYLPGMIYAAGVPYAAGAGLCYFVIFAMLLLMGPSIRKWATTGKHRMTFAPKMQVQKLFVKINA